MTESEQWAVITLPWDTSDWRQQDAYTPFGWYSAETRRGSGLDSWRVYWSGFGGNWSENHETSEEAKNAAQMHFNKRVIKCLTTLVRQALATRQDAPVTENSDEQ